jgi:ribosomal protein S18 acetylase RimI-like enzyme
MIVTAKECNALIKDEITNGTMWVVFNANIEIAKQSGLFFTKWDGDKLIGFMLCRLLKRSGVLSIDKIAIHQDYRKKGLGKEFLMHLLEYNLPIKLDVATKNENAIRFYERFGFRKVGEKQLGKNHISSYEFRN